MAEQEQEFLLALCLTFQSIPPIMSGHMQPILLVQAMVMKLYLPRPYLIGELFGGSRIFYVDNTNLHGLIVALGDQAAGAKWDSNISTWISPKAFNFTDSVANTNKIITVLGTNNAAGVCRAYPEGFY